MLYMLGHCEFVRSM